MKLNLIYDTWDESTGNPLPNSSIIYNHKYKFWVSESLIQHYLNFVEQNDKFTIKRCTVNEVYERKNEKFYYFIGNAQLELTHMLDLHNPLSDLIIKCVKECENFFIVFISEHESESENGFKQLINLLKENNINEKQVYVINNNDKLNEYKIKEQTDVNVYTLSFLPHSAVVCLSMVKNHDFIENKNGKFFMTFNKSPKYHRYELLINLMYYNIIKETNWSLVPNFIPNIDYNTFLSMDEIENFKNEINYLNNLTIKLSDYEEDKNWFDNNNLSNRDGLSIWMAVPEFAFNHENSYVNIVTESHYFSNTNTIHITEKSFRPFYYYQFPLILATYGHIKKMREKYEFDFFDDIIDHSYDEELDDKVRMKKFVAEIIKINNNKSLFIDFYKKNKLRFMENKTKVLKILNCEPDYFFFKNLI